MDVDRFSMLIRGQLSGVVAIYLFGLQAVGLAGGAIVLNIQRACEASIDAATHVVCQHRLDISQQSRDAFQYDAGGRVVV